MKRYDMLLVLPTTDELVRSERAKSAAPAYGVNVLATYLRLNGLSVYVLDEFMMTNEPALQDKSWKEAIEDRISRFEVKSIGFSVMTNFVSTVRNLIGCFSDYPIVLGGVHITSMDDESVRLFGADLYLKGHINEYMLSEIKRLTNGITPGQTIITSNGDAPTCCPDYSQYLPFAPLKKITTRISAGCRSAGCNFCGAYWLDPRPRVYPNIEEILSSLPINEGTNIEFHDSDFLAAITPDTVEILKKYLWNNPSVYCHARMESVTLRRLKMLSEVKAKWKIFIGLESASPSLSASMNKARKPTALEEFYSTVSQNRFDNIMFGFFTLVGVPGETRQDIEETITFLKKIESMLGSIDVSTSIVNVIPGSVYYKRLVQSGTIVKNPWWGSNSTLLTAVYGEDLNNALRFWNQYAEAFPQTKKHNTIYSTLLKKGRQ